MSHLSRHDAAGERTRRQPGAAALGITVAMGVRPEEWEEWEEWQGLIQDFLGRHGL
ncbi:hypothetical protein [Streptomyces sp. NPDC048637]|uniref:hypothetical protein n=1 Tax=Streptomyces sp. NPDC048637 TaxID=3155636 RepID=UPI00343DC516